MQQFSASSDIVLFNDVLPMPMTRLPVRSVLVRCADRTVLFSPLPNFGPQRPAVEAWGSPTDIVAPNLFHHLGLREAMEAFPEATVWAPGGIEKKVGALSYRAFENEDWPLDKQLERFAVEGMPRLSENVFFHRDSHTLICTDLVFNISNPRGFGSWLLFSAFGTYGVFGVSRVLKMLVKDRTALRASLARILERPIQNIVMAHGDIVIGGGTERLRAALGKRGLLEG